MKIIFNKQLVFVISAILGLSSAQAQIALAKKELGINVSFMDTKVKPNDDFFRFVNGTWLDKTEIPSDKTSWGSFNELRKKTDIDALNI